ncbi:MAG TPA: efflux RND transporter periplasmic adaptor subunit [Casimicrobiaceae bacterium]|nr:efflux RND transporter periplasmic adaptor subunit [Casimicrobiaceae bacterium]
MISPPNRRLPALALLVAVTLIAAGCGEKKPEGGGMPSFPPASVGVEVVQPKSYPVTFEYVGQAIGSKDAEVRSRVTGIVDKRLYEEGSRVKAGQPLFQIDPRTYQAQLASAEAEIARAHAEASRAQREVARLRPLAERKAIGQKEADDAQSQVELAAAAVKFAEAKVAEARLNHSFARVTAPISGVTGRAEVSEGSLATANQTLLTTISQTDPIWVGFSIPETERLKLERARAQGKLSVPNGAGYDVELRLADGSVFARTGRINFADTRIDPKTGTSEMRATVANADGALKRGQFVRVVLKGAERPSAIAVPQVAVMEGPQGKFVYVVGRNDQGMDVATPKPIVAGEWTIVDGRNLWIVDSGLVAGDRVIVDGVARLMPGAPVQTGAPGAPPAGPPGAPPAKPASKA